MANQDLNRVIYGQSLEDEITRLNMYEAALHGSENSEPELAYDIQGNLLTCLHALQEETGKPLNYDGTTWSL